MKIHIDNKNPFSQEPIFISFHHGLGDMFQLEQLETVKRTRNSM